MLADSDDFTNAFVTTDKRTWGGISWLKSWTIR